MGGEITKHPSIHWKKLVVTRVPGANPSEMGTPKRSQDVNGSCDFGHWKNPREAKDTTRTWQFFVTFLGWLSDPLKWLSDLQLGDEKITLNRLGWGCFFRIFLIWWFWKKSENHQREVLKKNPMTSTGSKKVLLNKNNLQGWNDPHGDCWFNCMKDSRYLLFYETERLGG